MKQQQHQQHHHGQQPVRKGESQRIYWQQWLSAKGGATAAAAAAATTTATTRRELITSSAAIRISPDAAKARDVTQLLRDTLQLSSLTIETESIPTGDSLVLVGSLYSLPRDYVQFEHEIPYWRQRHQQYTNDHNNNDPSSSWNVASSSSPLLLSTSEPYHVIQTLQPDDNPLMMRDQMMEHLRRIQQQAPKLKTTNHSIIAPKVQWYYIPMGMDPMTSPIPSCIELDGYCTSLEDEDYCCENDNMDDNNHDPDETDTDDVPSLEDPDLLLSRIPFFFNDDDDDDDDDDDELSSPPEIMISHDQLQSTLQQRKWDHQRKQYRRYTYLRQFYESNNNSNPSGFLLKQSRTDPHVWRKVFCILTDENLWFVTRIPQNNTSMAQDPLSVWPPMGGHHGKIPLTGGAMLLESTTNPTELYYNNPASSELLHRIPHAFEIVTSKGTSHIFRTTNGATQKQWIQAIGIQILQAEENSLLRHAELIVADESVARNQRFAATAVLPLVVANNNNGDSSNSGSDDCSSSLEPMPSFMKSVLLLGMEVSEFREQCRHIRALMPARQAIVAVSGGGDHHHLPPASIASTSDNNNNNNTNHQPLLNPPLRHLVETAWDMAASLLAQATRVIVQQQHKQQHMSRSLETLCRHVDYIITGQHRKLSLSEGFFAAEAATTTTSRSSSSSSLLHANQDDPPPVDLFDLLLAELQTLAATTTTNNQQ